MRLLFIEDDQAALGTLPDSLRENDHVCDILGFEEAKERLKQTSSDIVILDLFEGADNPGNIIFDFIWENTFCPVIVHSAHLSSFPEDYKSHPFVELITKGRTSLEELEHAITEFQPHVDAIGGLQRHVDVELSQSLKHVAPFAFKSFSDPEQQKEVILRSGRRRLAALMDATHTPGEILASWEKYLYPPVSSDIKLGDILQKSDGSYDDPTSFRIVLTPSCDMVTSSGRDPKVTEALVALCVNINEGLKLVGHETTSDGKLRKRLPDEVLTQGYFQSTIPLPQLTDKIPSMFADLKKLELIKLCDIGFKSKPFLRIASIDSPFREMVSWAFLQSTGRPGLPVRDTAKWCEEIITNRTEESESE